MNFNSSVTILCTIYKVIGLFNNKVHFIFISSYMVLSNYSYRKILNIFFEEMI